jgi:hypothetical protein
MHRYGTKEGRIAFDDFMSCAVRLRSMIGGLDIFVPIEEFASYCFSVCLQTCSRRGIPTAPTKLHLLWRSGWRRRSTHKCKQYLSRKVFQVANESGNKNYLSKLRSLFKNNSNLRVVNILLSVKISPYQL